MRFIRIGTNCLGSFQVKTSNNHVDRMVNIWNAYQCMVTFNMSRSASLFEVGNWTGLGLPRLKSGFAWICSYGSFAGT